MDCRKFVPLGLFRFGKYCASVLAVVLASPLVSAGTQPADQSLVRPDACYPGSIYGNGSDGDRTISGTVILTRHMEYRDLVVSSTGRLDTRGYTVRACRDFTVQSGGIVHDGASGGGGGAGGARGYGANPKGSGSDPTGCGRVREDCTGCGPGTAGGPPLVPQAGFGGDGHGGGGGGGGGWSTLGVDADGGNGGAGGAGGKGGGYLLIYAYRVANSGTIHADGGAGGSGGNAPNGHTSCGAEYFRWGSGTLLDPYRDLAGGGGGGGGGGDGGDGGTVEIHYTYPNPLPLQGIRASGGTGGVGGTGGNRGGCLSFGVPLGGHSNGCYGTDGGGSGGKGADEKDDCAGSGSPGAHGDSGAAGTVSPIWHPASGYSRDDFDAIDYDIDLSVDFVVQADGTVDGTVDGTNVMSVKSLVPGASTFCFRLDRIAFGGGTIVDVRAYGIPTWVPRTRHADWDWENDVTACVNLDRTYDANQKFEVRVHYAGHPRTIPVFGDAAREGMIFTTHGEGAEKRVAIFTFSEPWYAYLWLPVKENGTPATDEGRENYNCDKVTAGLSVAVPGWMEVAANGTQLPGSPADIGGSRKRFDWRTTDQTANYLLAFCATNYHHERRWYGALPVDLYVYPEDEEIDRWTHQTITQYEKTAAWWNTLDSAFPDFSAIYGPYPFAEKYGICEWSNGTTAMEHQTISAQPGAWGEPYLRNYPLDEVLTVHELAHQWWGDMVTCETWNDIWLNESLAGYSEALWFEEICERENDDCASPVDGRLAILTDYMNRKRLSALKYLEMKESIWRSDVTTTERIFKAQYSKGPWIPHMLRYLVNLGWCEQGLPAFDSSSAHGDTADFFALLRHYRGRRADGCANYSEFVGDSETYCDDGVNPPRCFFDAWANIPDHPGWGTSSGNLRWFFDPFVKGAGAPGYRYWWSWFENPTRLKVWQVQRPAWNEPVFTMPIVFEADCPSGASTRAARWNDGPEETHVPIAAGCFLPSVRFDPDGWILKRFATPKILPLVTDLRQSPAWVSRATALNERGHTVGDATNPTTGEQYGYLWLPEPAYGLEPGLHELDTAGVNASRVTPLAINEHGQIAGEFLDPSGVFHAFLWLPQDAYGRQAGMHDIGTLDGPARAKGINDGGQIVGSSGTTGAERAFLWLPEAAYGLAAGMNDLGTLGGAESRATAINDFGQVVGASKTSNGEVHGFVWENGHMEDLGEGEVLAISDSGITAGRYATEPTIWLPPEPVSAGPVPLISSAARTWVRRSLPPLAPGFVCLPLGVNDAGDSVGHCVDGSGNSTAVIWRDGVVQRLNDVYLGSVASCRILTDALHVNDTGQIAGVAGSSRAYLLDPDGLADCDGDGTLDTCQISAGSQLDCNYNDFPDACDISGGYSPDVNADGVPDECTCLDEDGDGFGASGGFGCPGGYRPDCDDTRATARPGALELCNDLDDDCDTAVDEDEDGIDSDSDGVRNACDNCRFAANPNQLDTDGDRFGNACDNCAAIPNPDQSDPDGDLLGAACDNCPSESNPSQADLDGDRAGDACDNCLLEPNPSQGDLDADSEGDVCDLDDGLILILFSDPDSIRWQAEEGPSSWNVYEGDLAVLRSEGTYTQLPRSNPLADRRCGVAVTWVNDLDNPPTGSVAFCLVTGVAGGVETDLGRNSAGVERPNTNPCP